MHFVLWINLTMISKENNIQQMINENSVNVFHVHLKILSKYIQSLNAEISQLTIRMEAFTDRSPVL